MQIDTAAAAAETKKEEKKRSFLRDVAERFVQHKLAVVSAVLLVIEVLLIIFLPMILKLDPITSDFMAFESAPGKGHILGTDDVGRDVFARLVYGGRVSLSVGFCSSIISLLIGVPLGLIAGYYRGAAEIIILRASEIFSAIPSMILILVVVSITGTSIVTLTCVMGVMGWTGFTKMIYGSVLSAREKEYVEAARAIGEKDRSILVRYILPNTVTPILISFTFHIASAILQESGLSFLGLGVQPPQASWGNILNGAQSISVLTYQPWRWIPAGILLLITVSAINFVGDGLRDALDVSYHR
ncbi:MAG: ABC transporter permease [Lachnospiraceae bacterium]|nr:ABC transporter permease [Lachnospiraceae bacterium]